MGLLRMLRAFNSACVFGFSMFTCSILARPKCMVLMMPSFSSIRRLRFTWLYVLLMMRTRFVTLVILVSERANSIFVCKRMRFVQ